MSVAIIINPVAGGVAASEVARRIGLATSMLERLDEPGHVRVSQHRGHARELAADAAASGARLVMAWGGDGTVNEVASALVGGESALGIIPAGSGNGLARHLAVAGQPKQAIAQALAAVPREIDVGELAGRIFVSVAGIGFDAHVAGCFDRDVSGRRGLSTYARITVRELWRYQPAVYRINGSNRDRRALLITFANSAQFGNGARIAPAARIDDGLLDMVLFEETSRFATVCGLPRLFNGSIGGLRGVSTEQITHAIVQAAQPIAFHVDGEPVQGGTSLRAQVRAGALRVCVT